MGTTERSWREYREVGVGTFRATPRMHELVAQALDSGRISYGVFSKEFENRFAKMHGCRYGVLANSGTSALQVALQALVEIHHWEPGDRVIVPATTFVATANIVLHNRLIPVFVDVDPYTYNIDPEKVERAAKADPDIKAVIPVHLFGQPADMTAISDIAGRYGLKIIEDSCETMFVGHCGRPVGSWGDIGCFSTYVAHLLVTGVGGLATTNNPDYAAKIRSLVNHGLDFAFLNPDENYTPRPMPGRRFRFSSIGHSYRITELEAALGLAQLDTAGEMLRIRSRNAKHLTAGLDAINRHYGERFRLPRVANGNGHAWMMYPVVLTPQDGWLADKEPLMAWLNERGIETRDMLPILGQPITAYRYLDPENYPTSRWILKSGFYVGCHQNLSPEDIQYVITAFEDFVTRSRDGNRRAAQASLEPANLTA